MRSGDPQDANLFTLVRDLGSRIDRQTDTLSMKIDSVARDVGEQIDDVNTAKTAAHKDLWQAVGRLETDIAQFKGRIYGAMAALTFVVTFVVAAFVVSDHL